MTSLSKLFRSERTISTEGKVKEITIRSLQKPVLNDENDGCSMEAINFEKERLLNEAKRSIEIEKANVEKMRQTALEDIEAMQVAWEQEKLALQQQAYEEAFQAGYEEGRNKAISEMHDSIQTANAAIQSAHDNAKAYLESQERVILEIAMRAASRILGKVLTDDEESFLSIVRRGLKEAREMKEIKLYVSLDHYDIVSSNRAELSAIFPPDIPFLIFANDDFQAEDCIIETNHGRIVVSVDEQLNELKEQLVELMESGD